jgi:hypothetical protein
MTMHVTGLFRPGNDRAVSLYCAVRLAVELCPGSSDILLSVQKLFDRTKYTFFV